MANLSGMPVENSGNASFIDYAMSNYPRKLSFGQPIKTLDRIFYEKASRMAAELRSIKYEDIYASRVISHISALYGINTSYNTIARSSRYDSDKHCLQGTVNRPLRR